METNTQTCLPFRVFERRWVPIQYVVSMSRDFSTKEIVHINATEVVFCTLSRVRQGIWFGPLYRKTVFFQSKGNSSRQLCIIYTYPLENCSDDYSLLTTQSILFSVLKLD